MTLTIDILDDQAFTTLDGLVQQNLIRIAEGELPKRETKQQTDEWLQRLIDYRVPTEEEMKSYDEASQHLRRWTIREF